MEWFKYGDSSQYENSCKNWTLTVVEVFVGFCFFFFLTVIFLLILGPFPLCDRVQETLWLPDIYRIDRKWLGNGVVWMAPQLTPGSDFLNLLFVTQISWVLWSRICYLLNTLNFAFILLAWFCNTNRNWRRFQQNHDALKLCPPMC